MTDDQIETIVIDMNRGVQCSLCGNWDDDKWGVPTVNGDVVSSDFPDFIYRLHGGNASVCRVCFDRHEWHLIPTFDHLYYYLGEGFTAGSGI